MDRHGRVDDGLEDSAVSRRLLQQYGLDEDLVCTNGGTENLQGATVDGEAKLMGQLREGGVPDR